MKNPTDRVITDRNDLDDQLFGTFARCKDLLRQNRCRPTTGASLRESAQDRLGRRDLHDGPQVLSPPPTRRGSPVLSDRRNIVVMADEAHRSQYDFVDGFAATCGAPYPAHRSSASPARRSRSRREYAGGLRRLRQRLRHRAGRHDGATVPIYYESRLAG
jgi:type I restriction enzyme R subunit